MVLPGLFSTMTGCPQRSCSSFPISRPEMSSGPPGGNGTTRCTGFEGKSCAVELVASVNTHTRTAVIRLIVPPRREPIRPSPPGESASRRGYNCPKPIWGRYDSGPRRCPTEQVLDRQSYVAVARHLDVQEPRELAALLRGISRAGGGAPREARDDAAPWDGDVRRRRVHRRENPQPARPHPLGFERRHARGSRPGARRGSAAEGRVRNTENQQGARTPRRVRLLLPGPRQQLVGDPARAARRRRLLRPR